MKEINQPIVCVIVPAYNASKSIRICLDSLITQTLKAIEIFVINDCSQDDTASIIKNEYPQVVFINNEVNCGPSISRNKGLDIARGKYIGFVDSDDYVDLHMFEKMAAQMNDEVDLVACSRINLVGGKEKLIINENKETDAKKFTATSNFNCDKLMKKSIIDQYKLRFPKQYSYAEDFWFGVRYKYYSNQMKILQDPFYYYLYDSSGSITNSYKENLMDIIKVLDDTLNFFRSENAFEKYEDELLLLSAMYYVRRIKEFSRFANKDLQRRYVKEFLNYFKRNFKEYKNVVNNFKTKKSKFYRSNYFLMMIYIELLPILKRSK